MKSKTKVIVGAVEQYAERQTKQARKRFAEQAERLNGDRLAQMKGAASHLRKVLDEWHKIAPEEVRKFAASIGWGDRFPA